jgi:hypothetical protein
MAANSEVKGAGLNSHPQVKSKQEMIDALWGEPPDPSDVDNTQKLATQPHLCLVYSLESKWLAGKSIDAVKAMVAERHPSGTVYLTKAAKDLPGAAIHVNLTWGDAELAMSSFLGEDRPRRCRNDCCGSQRCEEDFVLTITSFRRERSVEEIGWDDEAKLLDDAETKLKAPRSDKDEKLSADDKKARLADIKRRRIALQEQKKRGQLAAVEKCLSSRAGVDVLVDYCSCKEEGGKLKVYGQVHTNSAVHLLQSENITLWNGIGTCFFPTAPRRVRCNICASKDHIAMFCPRIAGEWVQVQLKSRLWNDDLKKLREKMPNAVQLFTGNSEDAVQPSTILHVRFASKDTLMLGLRDLRRVAGDLILKAPVSIPGIDVRRACRECGSAQHRIQDCTERFAGRKNTGNYAAAVNPEAGAKSKGRCFDEMKNGVCKRRNCTFHHINVYAANVVAGNNQAGSGSENKRTNANSANAPASPSSAAVNRPVTATSPSALSNIGGNAAASAEAKSPSTVQPVSPAAAQKQGSAQDSLQMQAAAGSPKSATSPKSPVSHASAASDTVATGADKQQNDQSTSPAESEPEDNADADSNAEATQVQEMQGLPPRTNRRHKKGSNGNKKRSDRRKHQVNVKSPIAAHTRQKTAAKAKGDGLGLPAKDNDDDDASDS